MHRLDCKQAKRRNPGIRCRYFAVVRQTVHTGNLRQCQGFCRKSCIRYITKRLFSKKIQKRKEQHEQGTFFVRFGQTKEIFLIRRCMYRSVSHCLCRIVREGCFRKKDGFRLPRNVSCRLGKPFEANRGGRGRCRKSADFYHGGNLLRNGLRKQCDLRRKR